MNLIFDVDDTLYNQLEPFGEAYRHTFGKYKYDCSLDDLFIRSRLYSDEVFEQVSRGDMTDQQMHIYRITHAFADLGIDIPEEEAISFQQCYADNQQRLRVDPRMEEALNFARDQGLRIGIITNGPAQHQADKVRQLRMERWVQPQDVFISGKVGIAKPDPGIFRAVEQGMHIQPSDTYYLGDSYTNDVVGAKQSGWYSIWINRHQQTIPSDAEFQPDYVVDKDDSVLDVVKAIWAKTAGK
ncbi:HAD family hydrolase [Paenibacillus sp. WLX2291]|uniref:HAD family hydrolase n=1 Tax=Paenibacillus sp. WLX2291 TaxID=3296934 RepID=UPI00398456A0